MPFFDFFNWEYLENKSEKWYNTVYSFVDWIDVMSLFGVFRKNKEETVSVQDIPLALLNTFVEYEQKLSAELSQTRIANENLRDEVSIFLYAIVDIAAKVSRVNHTTASHLIYEHSIKTIGKKADLDSFAVFNRTSLYLDIFLEPHKAKGLWMMTNNKFTNPFAACMVAFGDVLTNPHCVNELESYYEPFALNLYDFFDSMDFQTRFMAAFDTYQEYVTRIANLIERMDKLK